MGTEGVSRRYRAIDTWDDGEILEALLEAQLAAVAAVRPALAGLAAAASEAAERLRRGGRLAYVGAGASGRLAVQDGCELLPTFGFPAERVVYLLAGGDAALTRSVEGAEDDADAGRVTVERLALGADDVVIGVAASGQTRFTVAAVEAAAKAGALTIGMAGNAGTQLLERATHPILLDTGAEPIAGSTRLKAGTAQKVALNLISTLVMLQLGHVYDGLMVDVRPTNAKLVDRSLRMLRDITGCNETAARAAFEAAGGNVKLAVLVRRGLTADEGRRRLAAAGGDLRRALAGVDETPHGA